MKKIGSAIFLLMFLMPFTSAQQQTDSTLPSANVQMDIEYSRTGDEVLLLDVSMPAGNGLFPAVIIVHGGGWRSGSKKDVAPFFATLNDANFVCFAISYRLAPKNRWPACLEDVRTAIQWVKVNAEKYKVDANCIALIGYSAGGQLACLAAMTDANITVAAVVGLAPPTDLVLDSLRRGGISDYLKDLFGIQMLNEQVLQTLWESSPINHIRPGLPPFLLIHGRADKTVPFQQSLNFKSRCDAIGAKCDIIAINNAPHRVMDWRAFDANWEKKMTDWLVKILAKK